MRQFTDANRATGNRRIYAKTKLTQTNFSKECSFFRKLDAVCATSQIMRQFIDADCSNRKRKNKKNLQRKNQIEPLEIIIKYKTMKKEEIFNKL